MDADSIKIETDEDGFWLVIEHDSDAITAKTGEVFAVSRTRLDDPEAFYDHVKAAILPWLMERDAAHREYVREGVKLDMERYGHVASWRDPEYHSVHADLYDQREGK